MRLNGTIKRTFILVLAIIILMGCDDSDRIVSQSPDEQDEPVSQPSSYEMIILKSGSGLGSVVSDPAGIACGGDCSYGFTEGTRITLTAAADTDSQFAGWQGTCSGTEPCIVDIGENVSVTAVFNMIPTPPTPTRVLNSLGTYDTGIFDDGAAEITAFDPATKRLFVVNGADKTIDVLDIDNPAQPQRLFQIGLSDHGKTANSVAFHSYPGSSGQAASGVLAVAVAAEDKQANGRIVLFDADGNVLNALDTGALPDMVTFTPDGNKILVANEGEPNDDYTVDPEGSVTIVDLSDGVENAAAATVGFSAFNDQAESLKASGMRIFGPGAGLAQDVEPEYIAVAGDSKTAYVALQENNAIAVLDIDSAEITAIWPLGFKDHSLPGNGFDASNKDDMINIRSWPTLGMYQPDTIALFETGGGTWIVTANEGDSRDYDGYSEEERVKDITLDMTAFPNAAELQDEGALGRLKITTANGDTDGDGDFDQLYSYGARSFTIWEVTPAGLSVAYDSGDYFEKILAERYPANFNANNDENEADGRSDDKGPEPEGVAIGTIGGNIYAFIGLERMGGIMIYDVTEPAAPVFVDYINDRNFSGDPETGTAGDLAPEGILFIPAAGSPSGNPMLAVASEISGTTTLYDIDMSMTAPGDTVLQLLHASDLEGGVEAIGRASNFAAIADSLERTHANTIIISAGDNYISGPFLSASGDRSMRDVFRQVLNNPGAREGGGRADISIMNLIGFDASALGNHEFDLGTSFIADIIGTDIRNGGEARWLGTQFPYLSANLDFSGDDELSGLYTDSILNTSAFVSSLADLDNAPNAPKIASSAIVAIGGNRFGVVGGTTPRLEIISSPGDTGVKNPGAGTENMADLAAILQPAVDGLRNRGIDKIILTTHLQQISLEQDLIGRLNGVDIVIAGGSDTILADSEDVVRGLHPGDTAADTYPIVTQNADGQPALIVSTDGQYTYVGRLVVTFDENGVVRTDSIDPTVSGAFPTTDDMVRTLCGDAATPFAVGTRGRDVKTLTDAVNAVVIEKDSMVYGNAAVYLNGGDVRTQETNLGNLTADANLAAARTVDSTVRVSIKNGGGIRDSIGAVVETSPGIYEKVPTRANALSGKQEGQISQLDIENTLKFNNSLTILTLTAARLLEIVEHGVSESDPGATPGQFPQVGGMAFSFDPSRAAGDRVMSLVVSDDGGDISDIVARDGEIAGDPDRAIRVVTLNFLAGGGDGYPFDLYGTDVVETEIGEQQALADHLEADYQDAANAYNMEDQGPETDTRIQNLSFRADSVIAD